MGSLPLVRYQLCLPIFVCVCARVCVLGVCSLRQLMTDSVVFRSNLPSSTYLHTHHIVVV